MTLDTFLDRKTNLWFEPAHQCGYLKLLLYKMIFFFFWSAAKKTTKMLKTAITELEDFLENLFYVCFVSFQRDPAV